MYNKFVNPQERIKHKFQVKTNPQEILLRKFGTPQMPIEKSFEKDLPLRNFIEGIVDR